MDGNVVCRVPDRLVPPGNRSYDWASRVPRSPVNIHPPAFEIDFRAADSLGTDTTGQWNGNYASITYFERKYFEAHKGNDR